MAHEPMWKRLRDAVTDERIYRLSLVDPDDTNQEDYTKLLFNDSVATMSDWQLAREADIRLSEDDEVISPDTLESFGDPLAGEIKWDAIRDKIHQTNYSDMKTKVRAGHAAGCIRLFVDGMAEGDIVLGSSTEGVVPGVVEGPARYSLSSKYYEMTGSHALYRPVDWAEDNGKPLSISKNLLPPGFGSGRRSIERVGDPSAMVELLRGIEWIDEKL